MLKVARLEALLDLLQSRGSVGVTEIAELLQVSSATARRDLAELERRGLADRTWGGVRLANDVDDPFQEALARDGTAKQRIAKEAARLVPEGATVILDVGTTTHYVAMELRDRDVTILTASLPTFEHLRAGSHHSVIVLGGLWSERYQCFEGPQVVEVLRHQQSDIAFLGCSGVSNSGRIRDTSPAQSSIKQAIQAASTRTYLLADESKFPGKGGSAPLDVGALDGIITNAPSLAPQLADTCRTSRTEVKHV